MARTDHAGAEATTTGTRSCRARSAGKGADGMLETRACGGSRSLPCRQPIADFGSSQGP